MSKIKIIIIAVVILAAGFFAYNYFFVSNTDTSTNLKDISATDSSGSNIASSTSSSVESNQNDQYVKQLIALRAISFNFDLFSDDAYIILHAANTDIPPVEKGRHNPFAPLESSGQDYTGSAAVLPANFQITSSSTSPFAPVAPNSSRQINPR